MTKPLANQYANIRETIKLVYRLARGMDYQDLCLYMLRINQQKDIDAILQETARCLNDILQYELFGFVMKYKDTTDVWIDPYIYTAQFAEYIEKDFNCQRNDFILHNLKGKSDIKSHNFDDINVKDIVSYNVIEINFMAKLYFLPKRKMLRHHETIITTIIRSLGTTIEKSLSAKQLENAAAIDPLTGCYNRRALFDFIESDIAYTQRYGADLSIIMIDVDNFKEVNDMHGHLAGDAVLKELATCINSQVRKSDYLGRYGGEEFVLVLPETSLYSAVQLAEKLRKKIESHAVKLGKKQLKITASFGVSSLENKSETSNFLQEADERLYKAKVSGKNCVVPSLLPCFADKSFISKKRQHKYPAATAAAK